jgi:hypothetical protein
MLDNAVFVPSGKFSIVYIPGSGFEVIEARYEDGSKDTVLMPLGVWTKYAVQPPAGGVTLVRSGGQRIRLIANRSWVPWRPLYRESMLKKSHFDVVLSKGGFIHRTRQRRISKSQFWELKYLDSLGLLATNAAMLSEPMLYADWNAGIIHSGGHPAIGQKFCIALHLHYTELWPEFSLILANTKAKYKLYVTLTSENPTLADTIRSEIPDAEVFVRENNGRDVAPFLWLLDSGRLDDYRYVCKIHGKKTVNKGNDTWVGKLWRRKNTLDLIGNQEKIRSIIGKFEREPDIGMIGVHEFHLPSSRHGDGAGFMSYECRKELGRRCNVAVADPADFYAGTMFWIRVDAMKALRKLKLGADEYSGTELGPGAHQIEYALERFFGDVVRGTGFRLADL